MATFPLANLLLAIHDNPGTREAEYFMKTTLQVEAQRSRYHEITAESQFTVQPRVNPRDGYMLTYPDINDIQAWPHAEICVADWLF